MNKSQWRYNQLNNATAKVISLVGDRRSREELDYLGLTASLYESCAVHGDIGGTLLNRRVLIIQMLWLKRCVEILRTAQGSHLIELDRDNPYVGLVSEVNRLHASGDPASQALALAMKLRLEAVLEVFQALAHAYKSIDPGIEIGRRLLSDIASSKATPGQSLFEATGLSGDVDDLAAFGDLTSKEIQLSR